MQLQTATTIDMGALQSAWQTFDNMAQLGSIQDESDYERKLAMLNALLDAMGDDEDHPLSGLLNITSDLVLRYEQAHHAIEAAEPKDALRFLMQARGMQQQDLASLVPQSNLSAILSGKRKISATLAGKLGKFFEISPAVFVPR